MYQHQRRRPGIRSESAGATANTQQVILSCVIGPEGHNGTKRGVKQY